MAFFHHASAAAGLPIRADASSLLDARAGETITLSADNSTSNATVNLFIDSFSSNEYQFAASIVHACPDQTIYAVQCTKGPEYAYLPGFGGEIVAGCGDDKQTFTITEVASRYTQSSAGTSPAPTETVTKTFHESCTLSGTTAAVCTVSVEGKLDGTAWEGSTTYTATGTNYQRFDVAVTAGAENTVSPTNIICGSGAAGLKIRRVAVWAMAGVFGVVGALTV